MASTMTLRDALRALGVDPGDAPDIALLQRMQALLRSAAGGAAQQYLRDVLQIPPEVQRVEHYRFETHLNTTGGTVADEGATGVKVPQGFDFVLKALRGYASERDVDQFPENWGAVTFQAREEGRSFDVFTSPVSMAELLSTFGPSRGLDWPSGIYRFTGGHDITPTFTVDTSSGNSWRTTGFAKRFGVVMIGDLVVHQGSPRT